MEEKVELKCYGMDCSGFEAAIAQLGYTIIDSTWNDETDEMFYTVKKKWLSGLKCFT